MDALRHRRSWLRVPGAGFRGRFLVDFAISSGEGHEMTGVISAMLPFAATRMAFESGLPVSGIIDEAESPPRVRVVAEARTLAARKPVAE